LRCNNFMFVQHTNVSNNNNNNNNNNFHIRTVHLDIIKVLFIKQMMHN